MATAASQPVVARTETGREWPYKRFVPDFVREIDGVLAAADQIPVQVRRERGLGALMAVVKTNDSPRIVREALSNLATCVAVYQDERRQQERQEAEAREREAAGRERLATCNRKVAAADKAFSSLPAELAEAHGIDVLYRTLKAKGVGVSMRMHLADDLCEKVRLALAAEEHQGEDPELLANQAMASVMALEPEARESFEGDVEKLVLASDPDARKAIAALILQRVSELQSVPQHHTRESRDEAFTETGEPDEGSDLAITSEVVDGDAEETETFEKFRNRKRKPYQPVQQKPAEQAAA